jgi:hypothetical protein
VLTAVARAVHRQERPPWVIDDFLAAGLAGRSGGWPRMWRFRGHTKWIFIGSSQFLHLVSMRVVLDCGVVMPREFPPASSNPADTALSRRPSFKREGGLA